MGVAQPQCARLDKRQPCGDETDPRKSLLTQDESVRPPGREIFDWRPQRPGHPSNISAPPSTLRQSLISPVEGAHKINGEYLAIPTTLSNIQALGAIGENIVPPMEYDGYDWPIRSPLTPLVYQKGELKGGL